MYELDRERTYLAAFKIGIRYPDRSPDMPYRSAWVITKVKGKNMPQKKKKAPASVSANLISANGLRKSLIWNGFG